jgi:hypothetical protein
MPLQKTYEELLASKINSRNYSSILPIIYNLRKRARKDFMPFAADRIIYTSGMIGDGATAVFNVISPTSYAKGAEITLTGTATYLQTNASGNVVQPAIQVIAQIDAGIKNAERNLIPYQVLATTSEISASGVGVFSFKIPSSITELLSSGTHYVYIDASSPDNSTVRLSASGTSNDPTNQLYFTRTFTIT